MPSRSVVPVCPLSSLIGKICITLAPTSDRLCSTDSRMPLLTAVTTVTDAIPITIPSMDNAVRILFAARFLCAMRTLSPRFREPPRGGRRSLTTIPSAMRITRPARAATAGSWVTMMTVPPCPCSARKSPSISRPVRESRLPVGSSASRRL